MDSPLVVRNFPEESKTRIALSGRLDSSAPPELRDEVLAVVKLGSQLVLDLSGLSAVSGQGLRMLLLLCRQVRAAKGTLTVEGASAEIRDLAETAGFGDLFRQ